MWGPRGILLRGPLPEDHRSILSVQARLKFTTSTAGGLCKYYASADIVRCNGFSLQLTANGFVGKVDAWVLVIIQAFCPASEGLRRDLRFVTTRPVDERKSSRYGECAR